MTATASSTAAPWWPSWPTVVGAPHEARFIVDEALGLGRVLGHPMPPRGRSPTERSRRRAPWPLRRAAGEPLQYVFGHWPFRDARPARRPPRPDPAARDRAGGRGGTGRGPPSAQRRDRGHGDAAGARRGRRRHRAAVPSRCRWRSSSARRGAAEVWATDASADALAVAAANLDACARATTGGCPARSSWSRATGSSRCPPRCAAAVDLVVVEPALRERGRSGPGSTPEVRAEPRAGAGGRARRATARRGWPTSRPCSSQCPGLAGPARGRGGGAGAAPGRARRGAAGPATRVRRGPGRAGPGRTAPALVARPAAARGR